MPRQTPLTQSRAAFLEWSLRGLRAGQPEALRTPEMRALADTLSPKRKTPLSDVVGCAMQSMRAWLNGPFATPMEATVREVCLALDEPDPGDPFGTWSAASGYGRRMVAGGAP